MGGVRQEVQETQRNRRVPYQWEWEKINGIGYYGKPSTNAKLGATEQVDLQGLQGRAPKMVQSIHDFGKAIDNQRVQIMLGILSKNGIVTMENIPSEKDRSLFSCERYQFFLDAPFEISNKCCNIMKKDPMHRYEKESGRVGITAQMASESRLRTQVWLRNGCNAFDAKHKVSNPMSFWTEQDVLLYIYQNHLPICSVYGEVVKETEVDGQIDFEDLGIFDLGRPTLKTTGCDRTGCMLCGFGCHLDTRKGGTSRFVRLKETHPKMHNLLYVCKNSGVTFAEAIDWINENGNMNIKY